MPCFASTTDRARLHYVDYTPTPTSPSSGNAPRFSVSSTHDFSGDNTTLIFIHGWPMSHRMFEPLLLRLAESHGVRCIASDRRGFGLSEWTGADSTGPVTYDTFASDTLDLLTHLDQRPQSPGLGDFYFVAASMGCGETALIYHTMPESLKQRCRGFVWVGASLPFPLATKENPTAPAREVWDAIMQGFRADRVGFARAAIPGVFGVEIPATVAERFEGIVGQADALAIERCVQIISGTDLTEAVRRLDKEDVKILVIHGDSDGGMPAEASANLIPTLATQAQIKLYEKAAHGLYFTHADQLLEDIFAFVFGK